MISINLQDLTATLGKTKRLALLAYLLKHAKTSTLTIDASEEVLREYMGSRQSDGELLPSPEYIGHLIAEDTRAKMQQ